MLESYVLEIRFGHFEMVCGNPGLGSTFLAEQFQLKHFLPLRTEGVKITLQQLN